MKILHLFNIVRLPPKPLQLSTKINAKSHLTFEISIFQ
jgi:hypothetical protein